MRTYDELYDQAAIFLEDHPQRVVELDAVFARKPASHEGYLEWFKEFSRLSVEIITEMVGEEGCNFQVAEEALVNAYSRIKEAGETD